MDPYERYAEYIDSEPLPPRPLPLIPPLSFAMVTPGVYRSGHPLEINFPMLEKLKLKTIVYLADQDYGEENIEWARQHDIQVFHYRVANVREPFIENNAAAIEATLKILLDRRNLPVLVHSNKGKHRVGVLVGCMRKLLQRWSIAAIHAEYGRFAGEKGEADLEFIELFDVEGLDVKGDWAPDWADI
ncbi:MAG: hypothetical protein M1827_004636 [Pycnora praestabilis]|nr:MAG: hypothetical protein M1827_004636 [Pycnora praestabilis]